jgi:hypothetical protein
VYTGNRIVGSNPTLSASAADVENQREILIDFKIIQNDPMQSHQQGFWSVWIVLVAKRISRACK